MSAAWQRCLLKIIAKFQLTRCVEAYKPIDAMGNFIRFSRDLAKRPGSLVLVLAALSSTCYVACGGDDDTATTGTGATGGTSGKGGAAGKAGSTSGGKAGKAGSSTGGKAGSTTAGTGGTTAGDTSIGGGGQGGGGEGGISGAPSNGG